MRVYGLLRILMHNRRVWNGTFQRPRQHRCLAERGRAHSTECAWGKQATSRGPDCYGGCRVAQQAVGVFENVFDDLGVLGRDRRRAPSDDQRERRPHQLTRPFAKPVPDPRERG